MLLSVGETGFWAAGYWSGEHNEPEVTEGTWIRIVELLIVYMLNIKTV